MFGYAMHYVLGSWRILSALRGTQQRARIEKDWFLPRSTSQSYREDKNLTNSIHCEKGENRQVPHKERAVREQRKDWSILADSESWV